MMSEADICILVILFSSNHNIHKSLCGLCFWASDPLIDRFYYNLSIKGSEVQKQRPHELLWMLWFDEKNISNSYPSSILLVVSLVGGYWLVLSPQFSSQQSSVFEVSHSGTLGLYDIWQFRGELPTLSFRDLCLKSWQNL